MPKRSNALLMVSSLLFLVVACAAWAFDPEPASQQQARLATYETSTGDTYFALSLSPDASHSDAVANNVVVLFDTSASQAGAYREDALAALDTMLSQLDDADRVKLVAVDLNSVAMTEGFVAPNSAELKAGLEKLQKRAPLGSTNMASALSEAARSFANGSKARSVVYVGDGVSRANLMQSEQFGNLVNDLTKGRIAVSSLAIGPQRDVLLLSALANQTGGLLLVDAEGTSAQQAGLAMAKAVQGTVFWPVDATVPGSIAEAYPKQVPPLRSDRDSILIGVLKDRDAQEIKVALEVGGKQIEQTWNVTAEPSSPDFGFLPKLVDMARDDDGLTLPTAGSVALKEAARVITDRADRLAEMGGQALRSGDFEAAASAATAAQEADPGNPQAIALQNVVHKQDDAAADGGEAELRMVQSDGGAAGDLMRQFEAEQGRFLDAVEKNKRLQSQVVQTEVEQGLNEARQRMATAPKFAKQSLTLLMESVERAPDLDAEVRSQLADRIESALREVGRRQIEMENRMALAQENQVAAIESQRLIEETARKRLKIKQLLDRFNSLLEEGKYYSAEEDIAMQVRELDRNAPTPVVALWNSRFIKNSREMKRFRDLRHRNWVDTLYQVEKSAIPFPDEPPIVYPDADVWEALSLSRKQWASVDLAGRPGSSEQRIAAELDAETSFEYLDETIADVVDDVSFRHDIPIVIDKTALEDYGIGTDTPVTMSLKGVTLRSAMRLMLNDLDLTYVIKDEVLKITTPEEAESELITKVYPVGDLVIPVISTGGMGGGMMGGGMGGMGGGMGGMGGGMGGFGGGMGGMGGGMGGMGGGMGGGFFAVEEELTLGTDQPQPRKPAPAAARVERLEVTPTAGQTLDAAWDAHFENHRQDSAADRVEHHKRVRETIRCLHSEARSLLNAEDAEGANAQLHEIVVMLQSALRNNQPQPWMYEAMSLALLISGAPQSEVERALMSAADFSSNDEELLHLANYMSRIGLDQRALDLYRNVAVNNPYRPEPFVAGLESAERLQDEEGIRWACVGILGQAWSKEHAEIEARARRKAEALLLEMANEKRRSDAEAFAADLNDSLQRDCLVRVTWTGDADLDLIVEEPSATVCSATNPRTTAGGVMLGDVFARSGSQPAEGYSERYVCPQGFTGQYRLLIKRVYGKVTAGKVTVEICTHYGTDRQTYGKQQIPIGEKDAIVNFDLADGRRTEPLAEEKLANMDRARMEVGRTILAQQFADLEDPNVGAGYYVDDGVRNGWIRGPLDPRIFRRRGAVGFQPQITQLPSGNQMMAMAIISADRRYVRFSLLGQTPIASGVTDVDTFNFVTGQSGQQGGGAGGFGGAGGGGFGGGGGGFGGGGVFFLPGGTPFRGTR